MVLASIIFVAGMFAFVPVQDASTVHSTFIGTVVEVTDTDALWNAGEDLGVTCTGAFEVLQIELDITDGGGGFDATDDIDFIIDGDGDGVGLAGTIVTTDIFGGNAVADDFAILDLTAISGPAATSAGGAILLNLQAETAANDIDAATATFIIRTLGTCTAI